MSTQTEPINYSRDFILNYFKCCNYGRTMCHTSITSLGEAVRPTIIQNRQGNIQRSKPPRLPYQHTHEIFKAEAFSDEKVLKEFRSILCKLAPATEEKLTESFLSIKYPSTEEFYQKLINQCWITLMESIAWVDMYIRLYHKMGEKDEEFSRIFKENLINKLKEPEVYPNEVKTKKFMNSNLHVVLKYYLYEQYSENVFLEALEHMFENEVYKEQSRGIECLSMAFKDCGGDVEEKSPKVMKKLIKRFKDISKDDSGYPSRIRFMAMDVIDLQKTGWTKGKK